MVMKALGLGLLIFGFALLNWSAMHARDTVYGAVTKEMGRMPNQEPYPRNEVMIGMSRVAHIVYDRTATVSFFSGVLMFVGGLLVAFGTRRHAPPQPDTAPNGGPGRPPDKPDVSIGPPSVS